MTAARPVTPPVSVIACWTAAVLAGGALLTIGPTAPRPEPDALSPYSLAAHLRRLVPDGGHDIRIGGTYGSGRDGAWQFVASITWRDRAGKVQGGTTGLPQRGGVPPFESEFSPTRVDREHRQSWTLTELDAAFDKLAGVNEPMALVEMEITPDGRFDMVSCRGDGKMTGSCERWGRGGDRMSRFTDELSLDPTLGALSVQRAGSPVGRRGM